MKYELWVDKQGTLYFSCFFPVEKAYSNYCAAGYRVAALEFETDEIAAAWHTEFMHKFDATMIYFATVPRSVQDQEREKTDENRTGVT